MFVLPRVAAVSLLLAALAACSTSPAAPVPAVPTASPWVGSMVATATRLEDIPATPEPVFTSELQVQRGPLIKLKARTAGRDVELQLADNRPLKVGTSYAMGEPGSLDASGARSGASLSLVDGGTTWTSRRGNVTVVVVGGNGREFACTFTGVYMVPVPGPSAGRFQLDGYAQAVLDPSATP